MSIKYYFIYCILLGITIKHGTDSITTTAIYDQFYRCSRPASQATGRRTDARSRCDYDQQGLQRQQLSRHSGDKDVQGCDDSCVSRYVSTVSPTTVQVMRKTTFFFCRLALPTKAVMAEKHTSQQTACKSSCAPTIATRPTRAPGQVGIAKSFTESALKEIWDFQAKSKGEYHQFLVFDDINGEEDAFKSTFFNEFVSECRKDNISILWAIQHARHAIPPCIRTNYNFITITHCNVYTVNALQDLCATTSKSKLISEMQNIKRGRVVTLDLRPHKETAECRLFEIPK